MFWEGGRLREVEARGGSLKTVLDLVGTRLHCGERVGSF